MLRRKAEADLKRAATMLAVGGGRAVLPDEILRKLGQWLPSDTGFNLERQPLPPRYHRDPRSRW